MEYMSEMAFGIADKSYIQWLWGALKAQRAREKMLLTPNAKGMCN